jgi:hypothetical protein
MLCTCQLLCHIHVSQSVHRFYNNLAEAACQVLCINQHFIHATNAAYSVFTLYLDVEFI